MMICLAIEPLQARVTRHSELDLVGIMSVCFTRAGQINEGGIFAFTEVLDADEGNGCELNG